MIQPEEKITEDFERWAISKAVLSVKLSVKSILFHKNIFFRADVFF